MAKSRTGSHNGVRYLVDADGGWYVRSDVESVLDTNDSPSDDECRSINGTPCLSSDQLATVVDSIVGSGIETMRDLWVQAWYEDLTFLVEGGRADSPCVFSGPVGEFIVGLIDENAKARDMLDRTTAQRIADERIADLEEQVKTADRSLDCSEAINAELEGRIDDMRGEVASIRASMDSALGSVEDCVTYLDGLHTGLLMANGAALGEGGVCNLFIDMSGVEDAMQRINSRIEDLLNGGDDGQ